MMKKWIILALAALAATSCMKEPTGGESDEGSGKPVEARFSLATAPMNPVEVRAVTPDLSRYEEYENQVKTLIVAQYVDSVAVYVASFSDVSKINLRDIPVTLQESPSHVYFLVNTLGRDNISLSVSVGEQEKKMLTGVVSFAEDFGLIGDGDFDNVEPLTMIGVWRGTPRGGSIPVPVKVYRSMAKMTLTLSADLPEGDKFNLTKGFVIETVGTTYANVLWRDPEQLDGEGVAPYGAISGTSTGKRDQYMLERYGELVGNPLKIITYMGESYYGYGNKGTAKYQKDKTLETGPRIPGVDKMGYTYIHIEGKYTDAQTGVTVPLVYKIYLGGNNTDDYNILRNHHYKVSVTLMGKSATDVRIEWNGNVASIDDYTVIRYAQQHRLQRIQTAKAASGLPWGEIYPGYDISTGKGSGTGSDGSTAKANWHVASMNDLKILYSYFRFSGNAWTRQIDPTDNTKAYYMSSNGQVSPADTTQTGDFYATWDGTLDNTVEKKYPYVSEDQPVVVSTEIDGTGIKAIGVRSSGSLAKYDSLYLEDPVSKAFLMDQTAQPVYNESGGFQRQTATNNRAARRLMVARAYADNGNTMTFAQAYDACKAYSEPDYPAGSWRAPTQREIGLIGVFSDELQAQAGFEAFDQTSCWSGAENSGNNSEAWAAIFTGDAAGTVSPLSKDSPAKVRCVRSMTIEYPYIRADNRIIASDVDGGLPASSLLTGEQKEWLKAHDSFSKLLEDTYFKDGEYDKVSDGVRIAVENCNTTNAPGVAVASGTYFYQDVNTYAACKAYREEPDGSDAGTWRVPTFAEISTSGFLDLVIANNGNKVSGMFFLPSGATDRDVYISSDGQAMPHNVISNTGAATIGGAITRYVIRCVRDE